MSAEIYLVYKKIKFRKSVLYCSIIYFTVIIQFRNFLLQKYFCPCYLNCLDLAVWRRTSTFLCQKQILVQRRVTFVTSLSVRSKLCLRLLFLHCRILTSYLIRQLYYEYNKPIVLAKSYKNRFLDRCRNEPSKQALQ